MKGIVLLMNVIMYVTDVVGTLRKIAIIVKRMEYVCFLDQN